MDLIFTLALSIVIVVLTILVNYEVLNIVWKHIPKIEKSPRKCIVYIMLAILAGHTFAVWIYGFGYLMIAEIFYKETLIEQGFDGFIQYLFASAQIYSSFGGAELFSLGTMRFLASIETLNGIVMVAWTFSLTYVVIDKTWQLPRKQKKLEQLKIEFKESKK